MDDIMKNTEQQAESTPTPEDAGGQAEKLFTQADLDRIIGERLNRERAKAEPTPEDAREADLKARENRMACREFIMDEGYPVELLDVFSTNDAEMFKAAVKKLETIPYVDIPSKHRKPAPRFATGSGAGGGHSRPYDRTASQLEELFKPPKI